MSDINPKFININNKIFNVKLLLTAQYVKNRLKDEIRLDFGENDIIRTFKSEFNSSIWSAFCFFMEHLRNDDLAFNSCFNFEDEHYEWINTVKKEKEEMEKIEIN